MADLVVRVPWFEELPFAERAHMPVAVVAVDLAETADVRTRRAGLTLLADALAALGRLDSRDRAQRDAGRSG